MAEWWNAAAERRPALREDVHADREAVLEAHAQVADRRVGADVEVRAHGRRELLRLRHREEARHGQLGHRGPRQAVHLLELEVVAAERLEVHQQELFGRRLGRPLRPPGPARRPGDRRVEPLGHQAEVRAEVGLAPDAEAEEVVERAAQHLGVTVELGHGDRPPPLLDGDLGRPREAELLGHDGLGQPEEFPRFRDPLADGLVGFHVVVSDLFRGV